MTHDTLGFARPVRPLLARLNLLLLLFSWANPSLAQVHFNEAEFLDAGEFDDKTQDVAIVDFNRDGFLDFVSASQNGDSFIFASDAHGGFVRRSRRLGQDLNAVAVGDFDNDLNPDIVASRNSAQGAVRMILGRGDGTFGAILPVPMGSTTRSVVVADFNEDGNDDLAVADPGEQAVKVAFGDGNAGFSTAIALPAAISANELVTADIDGDENVDLLCVTDSSGGDVFLYFGDGNGGFSPPITVVTRAFPNLATTGDFDGDGFQDIAISYVPEVVVHFGDGSGAFPRQGTIPQPNRSATSLCSADLDLDGTKDELIVGGRLVSVYIWDGIEFDRVRNFTQGEWAVGVQIGDMNLDGWPDVVAGDHLEVAVTIFYSDGSGGFDVPRAQASDGVDRFAIADFDEDGTDDIVSLGTLRDQLSFYRNDGRGGLDPGQVMATGLTGEHLTAGDFNGDEHEDVVVLDDLSVLTFLGDGTGGFATPLVDPIAGFGGLVRVRGIVSGDLDRDGLPDLLVGLSDLSGGTDEVVSLLADSSGGFLPANSITTVDLSFDPIPQDLGDLNGDGDLDLVLRRRTTVSDPYSRGTSLLGQGDGTFVVFQNFDAFGPVLLEEVTDDGVLDLLVATDTNLLRRPGTGFGSFGNEEPFGINLLGARQGFLSEDLNGDGEPDFAAIEERLHLIASDGDGGYEPPQSVFVNRFTDELSVGEFNGDGEIDLVLGAGFSQIWVLLNRTSFYESRKGNVNAGEGSTTEVVFVNGSAGVGREKRVYLEDTSPFELRVEASPSGGRKFALYAWVGEPAPGKQTPLPLGLGTSAMPMPASSPSACGPIVVWKNIQGHAGFLGVADRPSIPAPSTVLNLPQLGHTGRFYFQGLLLDPGSPQGQAAITNGIVVVARESASP